MRPLVKLSLTAVAGAMLVAITGVEAHKAITSQYTYNDDVFPILRDKCGRCHMEGGPAPMSLLTYNENGGAVAWAESMREMLISEAMPPWYADPTGPAVKNSHALTPRELDIVVTWAVGGTPRGDGTKALAPLPAPAQWTLGEPDLTLQMPAEHTLGPGVIDDSLEVTIPTKLGEAKWVRATDLLPGTPSMVRRALIAVENGATLAVWEPGDEAIPAPGGSAFHIPANAVLRLQIHYKKPWREEQDAKSDRSTIGLYFTDEPLSGKDIQAVTVNGPKDEGDALQPRVFTGTMTAAGRVLALRPSLDQPYGSLEVTAVAASGRRVPLLKLRAPRPEWPRRYWLADPVELPAGTTIEVTATPGDLDSGPLMKPLNFPLQIALDVVPQ
ncbi:MAG: hypothetical protein GEU82_16135 [Luteitalea sp.]|nr:hypothetical protein [Luteitalea sp.]